MEDVQHRYIAQDLNTLQKQQNQIAIILFCLQTTYVSP